MWLPVSGTGNVGSPPPPNHRVSLTLAGVVGHHLHQGPHQVPVLERAEGVLGRSYPNLPLSRLPDPVLQGPDIWAVDGAADGTADGATDGAGMDGGPRPPAVITQPQLDWSASVSMPRVMAGTSTPGP